MRELSVFCDESGDFGRLTAHAPFYLVSLVFHEQMDSIYENVASFERAVSGHEMGSLVPVHTAPLIRREG